MKMNLKVKYSSRLKKGLRLAEKEGLLGDGSIENHTA